LIIICDLEFYLFFFHPLACFYPLEILSLERNTVILEEKSREKLEANVLPAYIKQRRWFGGKAREIRQLQIIEDIPIETNSTAVHLLFLEVHYTEGLSEIYLLPVSFAVAEKAKALTDSFQTGVIARLNVGDTEGILYDGVYNQEFRQQMFRMIAKKAKLRGRQGELIAYSTKALKNLANEIAGPILDSQVLEAEQSNTSLFYGNEFFLKFFRRLEEGVNPDLEIGSFLTEKTAYPNIPHVAGALEYGKPGSEPMVLGILQVFVPNEGDAWKYSLGAIGKYFERVLSKKNEIQEVPIVPSALLELAFQEVPPLPQELIGGIYLERARLLGKRTAELHLALSSNSEDPNFVPEPFSLLDQRSIYQSMQSSARRNLQLLRKNLRAVPEEIRKQAGEILHLKKNIMGRFGAILKKKMSAMKIRIHGDYHLGQVLYTGSDFIIIDFEGEPAKALSERRLKRSPFRDVAGMVRSFHYAAYTGLLKQAAIRQEDIPFLQPWAEVWYKYVAGTFIRSYLETSAEAPFMPKDRNEFEVLLKIFLLDKAIYELGYELNNRPDWLVIPMNGIRQLLEA
jgi:maltose alpha-D-glucosyltransferase/alpha-amylase